MKVIETQKVIPIGVAASMVLGFIFGWGWAKHSNVPVDASGNWKTRLYPPACDEKNHQMKVWWEKEGYVIVSCEEKQDMNSGLGKIGNLDLSNSLYPPIPYRLALSPKFEKETEEQ